MSVRGRATDHRVRSIDVIDTSGDRPMTKATWIYVVHAGRASTDRASAADEVRALYGRPDAEPLPAAGPDPAQRRRKLSFHGLLHRPSGTAPSRP